MDLKTAITILEKHQHYRLGDIETPQKPKLITQSIDTILQHLKKGL
jgi:hypothetical protein